MTAITAIGTLLKISAAAPATMDAAGFAALSYTTIGEVTDPGEFGENWQLANHVPLKDGQTQKFKTTRDAGAQTLQLALDTDDAGQVMAKAAALSRSNYSFVTEVAGGDKIYSRGLVTSFVVRPGGPDGLQAAVITIERNYVGALPWVEVLA